MKLRWLKKEEKATIKLYLTTFVQTSHSKWAFMMQLILCCRRVTLLKQKEIESDFKWQLAIIFEMGICLATDIPFKYKKYSKA